MLDRIDFVCISLKHRTDRHDHMRSVFKKLNIADIVTWWLVDKHPTSGVYGCFESHFNIWQKFGTKEYLCIFEDDIDGTVEEFYNALYMLDTVDAKIINLAPSVIYAPEFYDYQFNRGYFFDLAAYIIPRRYLPEVIGHVRPHFGIPIDIATVDIDTVGRSVFGQIDLPSDISDPYLKMRKYIRETISTVLPGFGLIVISALKASRSDPYFRDECRIPDKIVDRR